MNKEAGGTNVFPASQKSVSSYDCLDQIIEVSQLKVFRYRSIGDGCCLDQYFEYEGDCGEFFSVLKPDQTV